MKISLTTILGVFGRFLIISGVLILLFAGFQLWGTGLAESRAQKTLESDFFEKLEEAKQKQADKTEEEIEEVDTENLVELDLEDLPDIGEAVGIIEIESIGVNKTILEGVTRDALRSGPGRYPSTSFPGQPGNAAIAGHRTTYGAPFFNIDKVKPGDLIKVTTLQGEFFYEVEAQNDTGEELGYFIVSPSQTEVLADKGYDTLTLTACHPKYSAAQRIIVTAKLTSPPAPKTDPKPITASDQAESFEEEFTESLGWQPEEIQPTVIWGIITLVLGALAWFLAQKWRRWPAYAIASPFVLIALYYCFTHLEKLIPAI